MSKEIKVQVRYIGPAQVRIVERYEWNATNGYVQTVTSQAMVDRLLANGDFALVQTEEAQEKQEKKEE